MKEVLHNPVYQALCTGDQHLGFGTRQVKYFDEAVSPFVGFDELYVNGFNDLYALLPAGREILFATPEKILQPEGWQLKHEINGLQFIYEGGIHSENEFSNLVPLTEEHIDQMIDLAKLTKPGPFGQRTIEFGSYFGVFEDGKLIAMTGQRLHVENFAEISAVCTHPSHTGKGYARNLMQHQLKLISEQEQIPFLHVRDDNDRAIALYKRIGFTVSRPMNFYFMNRV